VPVSGSTGADRNDGERGAGDRNGPLAAVIALAVLCCGVEALLWASDAGWAGTPRWRMTALQYGAFWAGLLRDWRPNFAGQSVAMFATYWMLHAGPAHLAGNMAALAWLGLRVTARMGQARFAAVWAVSALGGGAAFGALATSFAPMVGASGALFGLMGALVVLDWRRDRNGVWVAQITGLLVLLNLAMLWTQGGVLAWQTHLGGYLAGAAMAAVLGPGGAGGRGGRGGDSAN
jgi:membrane associated rhomboid family serine protease